MGSRFLTKEEKKIIVDMYENNVYTTTIAKQLNRSSSCIERYLKRNGYTKFGKRKRISEEDIDFILHKYQEGFNCADIHKTYFSNVYSSPTMIERIVKNNELSRGKYKKQIVLNEQYFENIDNEHKAYWLGFLFADGSVTHKSENSCYIKLELNYKDKYIIEEFAKDIETDRDVHDYDYGKKHNAELIVYSKTMADDLSKYGIVPRKTYKDNHIPNISTSFMNHFIRGYFDGDGCISLIKPKDQKIHRATLSFCADYTLAIELQELFESINVSCRIIDMKKYGNDIYSIRIIGNENVIKMFNYMYKDSSVYLIRKYDKFIKFLNERNITTII